MLTPSCNFPMAFNRNAERRKATAKALCVDRRLVSISSLRFVIYGQHFELAHDPKHS